MKLLVLLCLTGYVLVHAQDKCTDVMLLNGSETLVQYGLDTTKNWWAFTSPYDSLYRLTVNGKQTAVYNSISIPQFSFDGNHWASFGSMNNVRSLVTESGVTQLPGTATGLLQYSPNSEVLAYSYLEGSQEVIVLGNKRLNVIGRTSKLFLNENGTRYAFVIGLAGSKSLVLNGKQGNLYDDITPIGFWTDGNFMYAARSGSQWRIYKGDEEVAGVFSNVNEVACNLAGTVCAAICTQGSNQVVVLIADEYTKPLTSRAYTAMNSLILHPTQPLYAVNASNNGAWLVLLSNTEYGAGQLSNGKPYFTHDGSELVYFGCDSDCFININGKRTFLTANLVTGATYVHKPKSETFGYSSASTLVFRKIEKNELWMSKMCDETSIPRYNWRTGKYEALGRINQRLYFMSCMN